MSDPIGAPLDRVDGTAKVTGTARYAADTVVAGVAHGVLVDAAIARGRITRIDATAAEAAPGVVAVLTHHNTPRLTAPTMPGRGQSHLPLQDDVIHHRGQHVAMIVAHTLEQAQHAAAVLKVEYHAERPEVSLVGKLTEAFGWPGGVDVTWGDPAAALAVAPVHVRAELTTPTQHHHPMEPWATIAAWKGDELTLYESTQGVSLTQEVVAATLGIPRRDVRVVAPFLGGGFGAKGFVWPHTALTAVAARVAGRPVKLVLTRAQSATAHGHRGEMVQSVTLGADRNGQLTAIDHTSTSQTSPFDDASSTGLDASTSLYACPNVRVTERLVRLDLGTPTPIRSPGGTGVHALETAMDELAYAIGVDPVELRLRNHADTDPATGRPWPAKNLRDCYTLGADRFGWHRRDPYPRSMRSGELLVGWGMATACHPYFGGAALPFVGPAEAAVVLSPDGRVLVRSGTQDIGTGTYTVLTQVAAWTLGLPRDRVRCELGDTTLPPAGLSAGSSTAVTVADAVERAARAARDQVVRLAITDSRSPLHGATPEQVAVRDGRLFRTDHAGRGETYRDILARHAEPVEARGSSDGGPKGLSYGAVFVEVQVDPLLGRVAVNRIVGAYDAGRILNHRTARSQAIGGIVWGLGMALTEQTRIDRNLGTMLTTSLSTYLVPVQADVPDIDVLFVDKPDPAGPALGARGLGEVTATGVSAAIVNAVHHATGRRVRGLPVTPDRLL